MAELKVNIVDAFARLPFRGNQAAVFVLDRFLEEALLQAIAQEMNLSETAFLVEKEPLIYDLRWFTPTREIDLCGHATLASAHILRERGIFKPGDRLTFLTSGGTLYATIQEPVIELEMPLMAGTDIPVNDQLKACIDVPIKNAEKNETNFLVEIDSLQDLKFLKPNMNAIRELDAIGLIVTTCKGCEPYDFASRYFAPGAGVPEDPVTGSAHCLLAPYWAAIQEKTHMRAFQASERSGVLDLRLDQDKVYMAGHCVTTLSGTFNTGETYVTHDAA